MDVSRLILPPYYYRLANPLIFLAGPIQGAPRWQTHAFERITQKNRKAHVASPRYIGPTEGLDWVPNIDSLQQINWETCHLEQASRKGAILFWLANEQTHSPGRCYAQTSRFELGEWKARLRNQERGLVLGIDTNFSGKDYIVQRFGSECPQVPIRYTLDETIDFALALIEKQ